MPTPVCLDDRGLSLIFTGCGVSGEGNAGACVQDHDIERGA